MNIAVVILWYLIGYVGCVWAVSRKWDVVKCDLLIFMFLAIFGPLMPIVFLFAACDLDAVVIRRRK